MSARHWKVYACDFTAVYTETYTFWYYLFVFGPPKAKLLLAWPNGSFARPSASKRLPELQLASYHVTYHQSLYVPTAVACF